MIVFVSAVLPDRAAIGPLPPSARLVYTVLAWSGPLSQQALIEQTALPSRTVRYALGRLRGERLIVERLHPRDGRQRLYSLAGREGDGRSSSSLPNDHTKT